MQQIRRALDQHRYETARRLAEAKLAKGDEREDGVLKHTLLLPLPHEEDGVPKHTLLMLHEALLHLGDIPGCRRALEQVVPADDAERLEIALKLGEAYHRLADYGFYRESEENRAGLTGDEYADRYEALAGEHFQKAIELATTDEQRTRVARTLVRNGRKAQAASLTAAIVKPGDGPAAKVAAEGRGSVAGTLRFADGTPVAQALVTLGLEADWGPAIDPATYLDSGMGPNPPAASVETMTARTDGQGRYRIENVPAGRHEFLAVTLDGAKFDIPTRFFAQGVQVDTGEEARVDATIGEWQSAAPTEVADPFGPELHRKGTRYRLVFKQVLRNPFHYDFPRQMVMCPVGGLDAGKLLLLCSDNVEHAQPFQLTAEPAGQIAFFADLPQRSDRVWALYESVDGRAEQVTLAPLAIVPDADGRSGVIDTGRARFRLPLAEDTDPLPPLMGVQGEDGRWRGQGRLVLPAGVSVVSRKTDLLESGPLFLVVRIAYQLSTGATYSITFTGHRDEACLLAHEVSPELAGAAFEFSLREFSGGRGYLHWTFEHGNVHWTTLDAREREVARLQESVAWWIPPQGFGYAMTADGLEQKDYIGVFTIRRGEWVDRAFEEIAQGPGDDGRELDWPFPEMVGSTISMITARTSAEGDAFYRFGFFDGERRWGILVSTLDRNDGDWKEISAVQHKNSSPRLQEFKDWRLDEQDRIARPSVVARRENLKSLRKKKDSPAFARIWELIASGKTGGAAAGLRFAVEGDPVVAWQKKKQIVAAAPLRARLVLLGRDYSDAYSPVGGRPITQWAEDFDLIAGSGVFTPDEERMVRQYLMLMGHVFMHTDLMNWKFNSRNCNFEADRVDVVGAVGLAFHGNPDCEMFLRHAISLMEKSLNVYCTPGSGKWYENPACYYLHASKCRMNLVFHLVTHGLSDPTDIPRLKDYLRWAVLLLTPRCPASYEMMSKGASDAEYRAAPRVRRVPPIGDHAHIGPWVPDHYAMASKLYRRKDPGFADLLLWAWQSGGADGGYFGNLPQVFAWMDEEDLRPSPSRSAAPAELVSRRLEGFGAIFRGSVGREDEFYLLFKQGPGGYRFHRTEGSIVLFANGVPLIYDGGEAGETWRHTTLSSHKTHMPLAPGHVERFASLPSLDFAQGVHPVALKPGESVFLSDKCDHELVPLAYARFNEPSPADVRSVWWIKDEYVILHDDLRLEPGVLSHWHLQAVADAHTGNAAEGYVFKGRFGTDLQVVLPGQAFDAEKVEQVPILEYHRLKEDSFSMRHLMLSSQQAGFYLAVLRPLFGDRKVVAARAIMADGRAIGVGVAGDGVDDRIFFARSAIDFAEGPVSFTGRYAAVLRREDRTSLILLDGTRLALGGVCIESSGARVEVELRGDTARITAEGTGEVTVAGLQRPCQLRLAGTRMVMQVPGSESKL